MTVFAYLDGTQLATTRIRLKANGDQGIAGVTAEATGEMGQGGIIFEDTASDLTVTGWMAVAVNETDCTSAPRLFTGYVADYHYEHGQHYRLTPERDIDTTINDTNVLLGTPILKNGDSPNRPAETDAARVAWLLGITPMANIHDLGFVSTDSILMDATNYLYATPADVLNDVCGPRNYIFFTYWDQSAREIGLFVAPPTRNIFTSTLSFSNDPADITITAGEPSGTCYPAYIDPTLTVDPSTVYCDIAYRCVGFSVEGHSQTTHDAFFASDDPGNAIPVVGHRGIVLESSRTGLVATARAAVVNLLAFYGSDRRTATFTTRLPSTKVGLLQAGMLVSLKFRHLPGLTTFTSWRVQTLTVAPTDGDPTHYDLEVTASLSGLAIPAGTGGGSTSTFPPQSTGTPSVVQTGCGFALGGQVELLFDNPVTVGHTVVVAIVERDGTIGTTADTNPTGVANNVTFTSISGGELGGIATQQGKLMYRVVTSSDLAAGPGTKYDFGVFAGSGRPKILGWELAGIAAPNASQTIAAGTGSFTFPSLTFSGEGLAIGYIGMGSDNPDPLTFTPHTNLYIEAGEHIWQTMAGIDYTVNAAGSQVFSGTFTVSGGDNRHEGVVAFFPADTSNPASPPGGAHIFKEVVATGDGTTTSFTTDFAFATGSLKVYVDLLDQTSAVTAQNGAAKTFTLGFAPALGEQITVDYLAAP